MAIEHDYWLRPDGSASVSVTPKEPDDLLRRSEFLLGAKTGPLAEIIEDDVF